MKFKPLLGIKASRLVLLKAGELLCCREAYHIRFPFPYNADILRHSSDKVDDLTIVGNTSFRVVRRSFSSRAFVLKPLNDDVQKSSLFTNLAKPDALVSILGALSVRRLRGTVVVVTECHFPHRRVSYGNLLNMSYR